MMKKTELMVVVTLALLLFAQVLFALPYSEQEDNADEYKEDYERLLENPQKRSPSSPSSSFQDSFLVDRRDDFPIRLHRFSSGVGGGQRNAADKRSGPVQIRQFWRSCMRRGERCDHRPNDCCNNSSCRCNLFGTNCFCERMGLFQQWGK